MDVGLILLVGFLVYLVVACLRVVVSDKSWGIAVTWPLQPIWELLQDCSAAMAGVSPTISADLNNAVATLKNLQTSVANDIQPQLSAMATSINALVGVVNTLAEANKINVTIPPVPNPAPAVK